MSDDVLTSWNDGPAKEAIVEFVRSTTTPGVPSRVPTATRASPLMGGDLGQA